MRTKEILNALPEPVYREIERLRFDYNNPAVSKDEARSRSAGYVRGLCDAGLISEVVRKMLFIYTTV